MRRIAIAAALAATSLGSFASVAGAATPGPVATVCGSVTVTVNGSSVVDQAACQVLPPQS